MKLIICTPEFAAKVSKATHKFNLAHNRNTKIACLGEAPGCLNLLELVKDVDENHAKEPFKVSDPKSDNLIVFWSSGTTGKIYFGYPF